MLENESEIVERAKKHDDAFEILYNFYFPKIYGYIFKRTGNRAVAEDIVSLTFMKVVQHLPSYKDKGHTFGAWLYKIATNNLTDHYRKQSKRKHVALDAVSELKDETADNQSIVDHNLAAHKIQTIINSLEKKHQQIISLKYYAQLSHEEIAETLQISAENSRMMLHRAVKKFKIAYETA